MIEYTPIIWVCKKCGSHEVETKQWVDCNTERISWQLDRIDNSDTWCRRCENHNGCVTQSEFDEILENKTTDNVQ